MTTCGAWVDINSLFGILGTLGGIVLGYFISKRLRRSDRLIEGIYEPLLGLVGQIDKNVRDSKEMPNLDNLEEIKRSGMYFAIDKEVKKMEDIVYRKLKEYQTMFNASEPIINRIIQEEVEKVIPNLEDAERYGHRPYDIEYRPHIAGVHVGHANLRECLRIGKTPIQFIKETATRKIEDSDIDCLLAEYQFDRHLADSISELAKEKVDRDPIVEETRTLRKSLLEDMQKLIEMLTKKVV